MTVLRFAAGIAALVGLCILAVRLSGTHLAVPFGIAVAVAGCLLAVLEPTR